MKSQLNIASTDHPFADNRERVIFCILKPPRQEWELSSLYGQHKKEERADTRSS